MDKPKAISIKGKTKKIFSTIGKSLLKIKEIEFKNWFESF